MSTKLSSEKVAELIHLYQAGATPTQLAQKYGIYNNSVTRILRKQGVDRTQQVRVSQDKINQVIEQYQLGISSETIASQLDINGSTVCRILKRNGIAIRPSIRNKKYDIDQSYFQTIDTEDKAYFLGFVNYPCLKAGACK